MHPVIGKTSRCILLAFLFLLSADAIANADSGEAQKKALKVIADFADRLCITISQEGRSNNLELSGKAKAELNELLKKVVNLGIVGAAKYQTSEWQGVLPQNLSEQLNNSRNCKLEVFKTLVEKLLPSPEPIPPAPPTPCFKLNNVKIISIPGRYYELAIKAKKKLREKGCKIEGPYPRSDKKENPATHQIRYYHDSDYLDAELAARYLEEELKAELDPTYIPGYTSTQRPLGYLEIWLKGI